MTTGAGIYFDGTTSARHDVTVEAAPEALRIRGADGALIAEWPYGELQAHVGARRPAAARPRRQPARSPGSRSAIPR